jgi:hypothetical protein
MQISRFKVSRPGSMIQKGKNRGFRTISHRIVDSEIAQSVNTFPEFNILGSYETSSKGLAFCSHMPKWPPSYPHLTKLRIGSEEEFPAKDTPA